MVLNKNYSIQILNEGVEESLPDYVTKIFEYYPEYTNVVELKLFNYNNLNKTSNIYLVNTELFNGYRDLFINSAYFERNIPSNKFRKKRFCFGFIRINFYF